MFTCAICCSHLNDQFEGECSEAEPNTPASVHLLESQLNVIFALRHIFEFKQSQLEFYLEKWGNPGHWLKFCGKCEEDLKSARSIFLKFHQVSRELQRSKVLLQERLFVSEGGTEKRKTGIEEVAFDCRRKFHKKCKTKPAELSSVNPFLSGDQQAAELDLKNQRSDDIKIEAYQEADLLAPCLVEYGDLHSNLEMFHDENDDAFSTSQCPSSYDDEIDGELRNRKQSKSKPYNVVIDAPETSHSRKRRDAKASSTKTSIRCPFCNLNRKLDVLLPPTFSEHLHNCAVSAFRDKTPSLKCSLCKTFSCSSNEIREFMEHIVLCRKDPDTVQIPWRHAIIGCNLCEDFYSTFPEYAYHVFRYHQHKYGCTQCRVRDRVSVTLSERHWKAYHSNLLDTPRKNRYNAISEGSKVLLPDIPWWCPGPQCLQQFADEASRDSHLLNCQDKDQLPERNLNCSFCGRDYFFEEELLMHRVSVHGYFHLTNAHKCDECGVILSNKKQLAQHRRIQHRLNLFKCQKCSAEFHSSDLYNSHLRLEHGNKDELEEFTCKICDTVFGQRHELRRHIARVHEKLAKICEVCGKEFENEISWKEHMHLAHPKTKADPHPCPKEGCKKVLRSRLGLKMHISKYHSSHAKAKLKNQKKGVEVEFKCSFCGKVYGTRRALRQHTRRCRLPKFKCRQCSHRFATRDLLIMHKASDHSIANAVKQNALKRKRRNEKYALDLSKVTLSEDKLSGSCNICKRSFDSLQKLKLHLARAPFHNNQANVICAICGARFISDIQMKDHVAKVHGEGYRCETCNQAYATELRLGRHQNSSGHSNSEEAATASASLCSSSSPELFTCPRESCGKVFKLKRYLKYHLTHEHSSYRKNLRNVEGDGSICALCGAKFLKGMSLEKHMQDVHGHRMEKECPICKRILSHKGALKMHLKSHTQDRVVDVSGCCEICGKIFTKKWYLKRHKATVHGLANFKCDQEGCSKAFLKQVELDKHKKHEHEGVKEDMSCFCQFCGKGFNDKGHLKRHEKVIHREKDSKDFQCDLCMKKFAVKEYLRYHLKYTHKIDPDSGGATCTSGIRVESGYKEHNMD